ncbi:MAG: radical SAM protein [Dehalococcoidia bacterium]
MRVLLLSTPYPLEEHVAPPLSLAYLAGTLEKEGFEVQILDFLVSRYRPAKLRQILEEYRPHLVGATCVTLTYNIAARMLKVCKDFDPSIVTVIGGPHASFTVERTLLRAPWIDVVVIGEGDRTMAELAKAVEGGNDLRHVAGIAFSDRGTVVRTEPRPFIEDLNQLPLPARHLLPLAKYSALGSACTMITSRGCPYGCIFCSANGMFGRSVRFRDPGLVVDEIEMLDRDFDFIQINIVDDTFTVNRNHARQVCEEMLRRKLDITWSAYARVDTITKDIADLIKRAGCKWVVFGVESADEGILKTIKKGITPEKVRAGVKIASDAGLNVFNSFIFGLPGETPDTARKSLDFAEELALNYGAGYGFHVLAPMPGTPLYDRAKDYGIRFLTRNWARHDANQVITETRAMSAEMMKETVAIYDQRVECAWEDTRRRAKAGEPECIAMLKGIEKQGFVWNLIKRDVIEGLGRVEAATALDPRGAEVELARRVSLRLGQPLEIAQQQVGRLVANGLLQLEPGCDGLKWRWSDGRRPSVR